jgi:hypothetical protein
MRNKTGNDFEVITTLQILNEEGSISWPGGSRLSVRFNLIEMQDYTNGVPGRKYSYGNLQFRDHLESSVVLVFLSRTRLVLTGGGIQTPVSLYGLNSFTVTGPILKIEGNKEIAA